MTDVQGNRGINVEELPDQNVPDDHEWWVNIHGINLTFGLKDILLSKHGWLTDEHIDAAQYLIRELGTGVGGLICVPAMTYSCSRFASNPMPQSKPSNPMPQYWWTLGHIKFNQAVRPNLISIITMRLVAASSPYSRQITNLDQSQPTCQTLVPVYLIERM